MVYANKTMLQSYIRGEILDDYYKIWLANYTTQTTYAGEYYAWQYSSKGGVSGISGYVDCNFFYVRDNYQNAQLYVTRLYESLLEREPGCKRHECICRCNFGGDDDRCRCCG